MKRREFIVLTGVGATGATLLSACGHPEEKLVPVLVPDEEYVPGIDYWKASTCGMCDAGCGIIVRTREHKANKIEGNPLHPVNRGALCARGQAGLQVLYNPDRIKGPLRRKGERGAGQWEDISWEEAIATLVDRLRQIKEQNKGKLVALDFDQVGGVTAVAARVLRSAIGAPASWHDPHKPIEPIYDIANATYLLSFGARFLETWHSPVMYSLAYGEFRRSTGKPRGRFVQIEPRMSLTGANADEWLPIKPGGEELIAEGIAHVIEREGLIRDRSAGNLPGQPTSPRAPEETADASGISAENVIRIAREFAAAERPLAIGTVPAFLRSAPAVDSLNALAGRRNKPGGFYEPAQDFDPFADLDSLIERGSVQAAGQNTDFVVDALSLTSPDQLTEKSEPSQVLLTHQSNPVYFFPSIAGSIGKIPFIVSFSSFMDETTQLSDLILPDHSYLERWDIQSAPVLDKRFALSIVQPVVKPEFNTRQTADVLLAVSRELGLTIAASEPFDSAESIVKHVAIGLGQATDRGKGNQNDDSFKRFSQEGVFVKEVPSESGNNFVGSSLVSPYEASSKLDADPDYPLTLLFYEHPSLSFGEAANLPVLQELPDPMTSVMWGSWVEMHPSTAGQLGIADGDLVEVTSKSGSVRLPAVLYGAIRPDVIAIPRGQGHTAYGRYAAGRGSNPTVLQPIPTEFSGMIERASGGMMTMLLDLLRMARRGGDTVASVTVNRAGVAGGLIRFGTDLQEQMEKRR